jgi:hypothetical protein
MTQSPEEAARPSGIPTTPAELEAWKEQFTDDLVARPHDEWSTDPVYPGGAEQPWQN